MDRVTNEGARRRPGIESELACRVNQSSEMVWTLGNNGLVSYGQKGVDGGSRGLVWGRWRLGWMDGVKVALGRKRMTVKPAQQASGNTRQGKQLSPNIKTYIKKIELVLMFNKINCLIAQKFKFVAFTEQKKSVPFSVVTEKVNFMHECCP